MSTLYNHTIRSSWEKPFEILLALALAAGFAAAARADQSATLAWNPDSDPSTAGYVLYSGTDSGNYTTRTNVGTNTSVVISGLKAGMTNYFVVTAYNAAGVEGSPSSQLTYLVPGAIRLTKIPTAGTAGPVLMQFSVAPGHWYQIEASTDLKNWSVIAQTATATANTWSTFQDSEAVAFQRRFYRLVMH